MATLATVTAIGWRVSAPEGPAWARPLTTAPMAPGAPVGAAPPIASHDAPAVLDASSGRPTAAVVVDVATQAYVPTPDEIPAEWAGRRWAGAGRPVTSGGAAENPLAEADSAEFLPRLAQGINAYRATQGLPPLQPDGALTGLADRHSQAMAQGRRLSHDGFRERLIDTGSRLCVENVAHNFRTVDGVLQGWRASPGHHRNLLEADVGRMGLANRDRYVTLFACR